MGSCLLCLNAFILAIYFVLFIDEATATTSTSCYSDVASLSRDIEAQELSFSAVEYIVCPGTFSQGGTIQIGKNVRWPIYLKCGETGALSNNCTFDGGEKHLNLELYEIYAGISVSGFTFQRSTGVSVKIYDESSFIESSLLRPSDIAVTFIDCIWLENKHLPQQKGGIVEVSQHSKSPVGVNRPVMFVRCVFSNNYAPSGTIFLNSAVAILKFCEFISNRGGWAIELQSKASEVSSYNSCFENNVGPIYIYPGSTVPRVNINNFGINNNLEGYFCEGWYDNNTFQCTKFTSDRCMRYDPIDQPSISPTTLASSSPSNMPSTLSCSAPVGIGTFRITILVFVGYILGKFCFSGA